MRVREVNFTAPSLSLPDGTKPGDEVIFVGRALVVGLELELVDVTSMGSSVVPEVILGEAKEVSLAFTTTRILPDELSAAELLEAAERIGGVKP